MSEHQQFVIFTIGGEQYALPIDRVREIIRFDRLRSISATDPAVRGVISLRGAVIAVHDLAVRLGREAQPTEDAKIVIVDGTHDTIGVIVGAVEEVQSLPVEDIDEVPTVGADLIAGIARVDERLVVLLDADRAFPTEEPVAV